MNETTRSEAGREYPPDERPTQVEAWLLDLGLNAIQVAHCPIEHCKACGAAPSRQAA